LATAFMIAMLASIGLPALCNFVGEYLVLQGAALTKFSWAAWAIVGVILSAAYMLWMYQRAFWGKVDDRGPAVSDLTLRDWAPLLPLIVLMVWLGSYTQSFMPPITSATMRILDQTRMNDEYRVWLLRPAALDRSVQIEKVSHAR
jgi:NADH-quinone oxidoreductase subunit M